MAAESHDRRCDRGDDAAAYALRALDDHQAGEYAEHLRSCLTCRAVLAELQPVVDALPLAAPQLAPPPALKSRIMAVVEAESELLRAAGSNADRAAAPAAPSRWSRRPRLSLGLRPAWAGVLACGALALGLLGGVVLSGGGDGSDTRTVAAYASGAADARLAVTGDHARLDVERLPSLSSGRVYQVWLDKGDGQLRPSRTLFNVRPDGRASVAIDESVAGVKKILVSAERSGGALAPSGQPVVTAALS